MSPDLREEEGRPVPPAASLGDPRFVRRAERALRSADPRLAALVRAVGPSRIELRGDPYRALVGSVLRQQLAGAAARAIEARLRGDFGGRVPRPDVLAEAPVARLRSLGLSRTKAETVRGVAAAFASGELRSARLRQLPDAAVVAQLTQLRGIGEWTAQMVLIYALGRADVLPVGDYGVRKGAQLLYALPELPGRDALEAVAEPWRPYRSVASWYLWRQVERGGGTPARQRRSGVRRGESA